MSSNAILRAVRVDEIGPGLILTPMDNKNKNRYLGIDRTPISATDSVEQRINYFEMATDFYHDGLWSYYPETKAPDDMMYAFEQASDERSINGFGAVVESMGQWYSIDTRYLWILHDKEQRHIGWLVGIPYSLQDLQRNYVRASAPSFRPYSHIVDRMKLIAWEFGKEMGMEHEYEFHGGSLGRRYSTMPVNVKVAVFGNGKNDYDRMQWLVEELERRLSHNSSVLDRHTDPHIIGPEEAKPRIEKDAQGNDVKKGFTYNQKGMYLPEGGSPDSGKWGYLTWDPNVSLNQLQTDRIIDMLHIVTGIPASAFGLPSAIQATSGVSLERQMFKATSKIKKLRRELQMAIKAFGDYKLEWVDDPFLTARERAEYVGVLYERGIISTPEARKLSFLGLKGDNPERKEKMEMEQEMAMNKGGMENNMENEDESVDSAKINHV